MSTLTPNYGLIVPEATDTVEQVRADYATNLGLIDNISGGGGHTIVDPNDSDMPTESKLQFTGNVTVTDDSLNGKTVVDIPTSSGSGHTIINPSGTSMTQRNGLKFTGNVTVTDDSVNNETIVNITGGGGGGNYSTTEQVIGTYLGKPLYQKTINFYLTATSSNGTYWWCGDVDYTGLLPNDIEHGWFVNGYYETGGMHRNIMAGQIEPDGHNLLLFVNYSRNNVPAEATFQYTKTTD